MEISINLKQRLASGVFAAGMLLAALNPASAHVVATSDTTAAGSYSIVTFGFGHGCEGSPTTSLAIKVPAEFIKVRPVLAPGWSIKVEKEALATPIASEHGEAITERTSVVTFTADTPVETDIYAMVSLQVALPEDMAGKTVYFPVVQTCQKGETDWVQIPANGQDPEELDAPAPSISITDPVK